MKGYDGGREPGDRRPTTGDRSEETEDPRLETKDRSAETEERSQKARLKRQVKALCIKSETEEWEKLISL